MFDWSEVMDAPGEIFDIRPVDLEDGKEFFSSPEEVARAEEEMFLDICNDLMMEGFVDEDSIEEEAHKIMDQMDS